MELQLEDPKIKEHDPGLILVDLCLMFRGATIKKSPVRVVVQHFPTLNACIVLIHILFFIEMGSKKEQGMYFNIYITLHHIPNAHEHFFL